jgi:purine-cytosine permease-like protein
VRAVASAIAQALTVVVMLAVVGYLVGSMVRSVIIEKRRLGLKSTWRNFGLSISLSILFFVSWVAQGVAQWQEFVDEQRVHGEPTEIGAFVSRFAQATLENWQSEFLQLFSFVVLAALLIHRGSGESKDSGERMEEMLNRIEKRLEGIERQV